MGQIKVGDKIDGFALKDQNDKMVKLSDFKGKRILLSWHPLAWTGVCTKQMQDIEKRFQNFMAKDIVPLGASIDHTPCKKAWADNMKVEKLSLLCDFWPHGKLAKDLGIFSEEFGFSKRINILLDDKGKVLLIKKYNIKEQPDFDEFMDMIENL
ncbi:MAG: redoxin domain-containing protein [Candidatus Zixiibacteriota bacterium]